MQIANNRRSDIMLIRVISMLMIVVSHTIKFYTFIPGSQILNQFFNVGVEIFLAISGFLYGKKNISNYRKWIIKRVQRIWIPFIIVVVVDIFVLKVLYKINIDTCSKMAYVLNLQGLLFINWKVFGNYITEITNLGPLWFTTIIMICYVMLPVLQKMKSNHLNDSKRHKHGMVFVFLLFAISFILEISTGTSLFYIFVFFTGYFLSDLNFDKIAYSKRKVFVFVTTVPVLLTLRIILRKCIDGTGVYSAMISIGHTIIGISLMCLGIELYKKYKNVFDKASDSRIIKFLDGASFYIYLVHSMFCMGVTNVYDHFNIAIASILFATFTIISARVLWMTSDLINNKVISPI